MAECIFCKIVNKEAQSKIVAENDEMIAFEDIRPKAPVHILIVPKKHFESLRSANPDDAVLLGRLMLEAARIAKEKGIDQSGYKVITNTGDHGGQIIDHFHLHLVGGEPVKVVV